MVYKGKPYDPNGPRDFRLGSGEANLSCKQRCEEAYYKFVGEIKRKFDSAREKCLGIEFPEKVEVCITRAEKARNKKINEEAARLLKCLKDCRTSSSNV
jgi:hypothetical protein